MRRVLLLLVMPLILIGPALLPGKRLLPQLPVGLEPLAAEYPERFERAWDEANYVTSDRVFPVLTDELALRERLRAGRFPGWQPLQGMGTPLLGGTIAGPLYPPNLLRVLLPPDLAGGWLALLALFLAGLGAWLFLERRELAFGACALGALGMQAGGWGIVNLHYSMKVDAALWLPWSLWAIDGVLRGKPRAGLALFGSVALSFLAGFPGVAALCLAAAGAYGLWRSIELGAGPARAIEVFAFATLGLGAAAVQALPMIDASASAIRQPQTAASLAPQCMPLASTLTLVVPDLFGSPQSTVFASEDVLTERLVHDDEGTDPAHANVLEWNLFAGVTVVCLAAAGLATGRKQVLFPALATLVALGFAQGWPGVALLHRIPGLNLGAPTRMAAVAWFTWPWMAAVGAHALLERRRAALLVAAGGAGLLLVLALPLASRVGSAELTPPAAEALAAARGISIEAVAELHDLAHARVSHALAEVALAAGLLLVALFAHRWFGAERKRWIWIPLGCVMLHEGGNLGAQHLAPRAVEPGDPFPPSESMDALAETAGDGRVLRFDASLSGVDDVLALARPNMPEAYGIADLTPYLVFTNRRLVELFTAVDPRSRFRSGISRVSDTRYLDHPVLDLARVTAILSRQPLSHARLTPVLERPGFHVYRRSGALPPARVVPMGIVTHSDDTALGLLASRSVDLSRATVLAPGVDQPPSVMTDFVPGRVHAERPTPDRFDVTVEGSSGGWLVMNEAFHPGWKATVNGEDAQLVRVDHVCRAVRIPARDSIVRTWYEPWSFRIGLLLCLASSGLALGLTRRASMRASVRGT